MTKEKMQRHLEDFKKRGIPICWYCEEDMEKMEEQSGEHHSQWKHGCKCVEKYPRLKDVRLMIG